MNLFNVQLNLISEASYTSYTAGILRNAFDVLLETCVAELVYLQRDIVGLVSAFKLQICDRFDVLYKCDELFLHYILLYQ